MTEILREVSLLSVLFGLITGAIPDRSVKSVTELLCTCILVLCILSPLKELDYDRLSLDLAKFSELEKELTQSAEKERERLNREVIEREYAAYILDKANELGAQTQNVRVTVKWSTEGIWVPWEAYIEYRGEEAAKAPAAERITADLGIPEERQTWTR